MTRLSTKRDRAIDDQFTAIEKALASSVSQLTRDTNLIVELCGWMHDNIVNAKGDFDNDDRADLNVKFAPQMQAVQLQLLKLGECYAVYDDDATIYAQNLANFVAKYPSADASLVDQRFS